MAIEISFFEFLKIGPGPSSSDTIGPMKAGYDFITEARNIPEEKMSADVAIDVTLYGLLAATGKGQETDRAILAGLLGRRPESCPSEFTDLPTWGAKNPLVIPVGGRKIQFKNTNMIFSRDACASPFSNTMIIRFHGKNGLIFDRTFANKIKQQM